MAQHVYAEDRYMGGGKAVSLVTGLTRRVHWEEVRYYYATVAVSEGTTTELILPYDVRNFATGFCFVIESDNASAGDILLRYGDNSATVATISAGERALVFLSSKSTQLGTWKVLKTTGYYRNKLT